MYNQGAFVLPIEMLPFHRQIILKLIEKNAMVKWFSQRISTAHIAKECLKEIEREKDEQLTVFYISIRNVYLHVHIGYLFCLTCSTVSVNQ